MAGDRQAQVWVNARQALTSYVGDRTRAATYTVQRGRTWPGRGVRWGSQKTWRPIHKTWVYSPPLPPLVSIEEDEDGWCPCNKRRSYKSSVDWQSFSSSLESMPGHKIRLSLASMIFSSTGSTPTTPSSEEFPPTPRSTSLRHNSRSSLSKFFGLSFAPSSPTLDFSKSHLDRLAKVQQCDPVPAYPVRRHTTEPQLVHALEKARPFTYTYPSTPRTPCHPQPRPTPRRAATAPSQKHESRCLQALTPRLFVAFEDDTIPFTRSYSEDLCAPSGSSFDNIVRITSHPRRVPDAALELYLAPREHGRYLRDMDKLCRDPDAIIRSKKEDRVSSLDFEQLVMARDFIFNAQGTVLITTPRDARTEAMTLALAVLAYSTGYGAKAIMRSQNAQTVGFKSVWQHTLSEQGLDIVKQVAAKRPVYYEDSEALDILRF